jgi:hypothetical protein
MTQPLPMVAIRPSSRHRATMKKTCS